MMTEAPGNNDLRDQLIAMQEQLAALQVIQQPLQPAQHNVPDIKLNINVKFPEGLYNMSPADFRSYSKAVLDYQILTNCSDRKIVLQMCLNMDFDLKRAIDTNYLYQWDAYNVNDALAAVKKIVQQTSNVAVYRKEFDNLIQKEKEAIQEFITRLKMCASDCAFICPFDAQHDLMDYHLVNRIRSGILDNNLQLLQLLNH